MVVAEGVGVGVVEHSTKVRKLEHTTGRNSCRRDSLLGRKQTSSYILHILYQTMLNDNIKEADDRKN